MTQPTTHWRRRKNACVALARARRVALFGSGALMQMALTMLRSYRIEPVFIVDNDSTRHGHFIGNLVIGDPGTLVEARIDYVVVASGKGYPSIADQLRKSGYSEDTHFADARLIMTNLFF